MSDKKNPYSEYAEVEKVIEGNLETVLIDGYQIPVAQAENFRRDREALAVRAAGIMQAFCTTVTRCDNESGNGEIVLGLDENNRELCRVRLDPYDVGTYSALTDQQMLRRLKEQKPQ
ncbi:MAG: hypothetical protein IIT59_05825 [Rhodocyclaceae bacterium]|nr:hypothetical protein [Rhodocyclaceae bacterium]